MSLHCETNLRTAANIHYNSTEVYDMKVILLKRYCTLFSIKFANELYNNDVHMLLSWSELPQFVMFTRHRFSNKCIECREGVVAIGLCMQDTQSCMHEKPPRGNISGTRKGAGPCNPSQHSLHGFKILKPLPHNDNRATV